MPPPPSSEPARAASPSIDALDIDGQRFHRHRTLTNTHAADVTSGTGLLDDTESLLSNVLDGIIERDRRQMRRELVRWLSYISAVLNALCAGSITAFSLYGYMFVSRLHYNLYKINAISITAELSLYLPVSVFGYLVDRYSPRPVAFASAILFATGYFLAAFTYRAGPRDEGGWPFGVMLVAFVFVGMGTCSMYLAAVTTCAKNFAQSRYKGLALSVPIAAFGLSGMWQSQIGSHLLYETHEDGSHGEVDVFRYFIFLGVTLLVAGLIGSVFQQVVNEEELIEDAVEGLERSGLLEDSPFFQRHDPLSSDLPGHHRRYGTVNSNDGERSSMDADSGTLTASFLKARDEEQRVKTWLLNNETRRFLSDHTMWLLALGFFLVTGPVETFINNLGTMLAALYSPQVEPPEFNSRATNVSVLALTSTLARLLSGLLSDLVSPSPPERSAHAQYAAFTPSASQHAVPNPFDSLPSPSRPRYSISRLTLLIFGGGFLLAVGYVLLLSPLVTAHPGSFVAVSAILGTVNGAAFALVPLLISGVWGVQNFGTNWGIVAMMPALGATVWSALYSVGYQAHVGDDGLCYGAQCFRGVALGMASSGVAAMVCWAWMGWGTRGWWSRGVIV